MPKDAWKRENDKLAGRRAGFEYATGQPPSFERLSEEVTPIDQIRPSPTRPSEAAKRINKTTELEQRAKRKPKPKVAAKSGDHRPRALLETTLAHFKITLGVSVVVKHIGKPDVSVIEALEAALAKARDFEAKTRRAKHAVKQAVVTVQPRSTLPPGIDLPLLKNSLKEIAENLVAKQALAAPWVKGNIHAWSFRVAQASTPSQLARLMARLAANLLNGDRLLPSWYGRRGDWSAECHAASSLADLARLLVEFGNAARQ